MTGPGDPAESGPRLLLVRHGQTDANLTHALDTRPPGLPLNPTGHTQAEDVAERLAGEAVIAVYASLATRAQQTAAPIAARHGLDVEVVPDVQEIFCGDLEGRDDHEARLAFQEVYQCWMNGELELRLPGGESAADVRARFVPAATQLWRRHRGGSPGAVVLVSHGGAIRIAAGAMLGEARDTVDARYVPNTGRVLLAPAPEVPTGWRLIHWDTPEQAGAPIPGGVIGGGPIPGDVTGGAAEPESPATPPSPSRRGSS